MKYKTKYFGDIDYTPESGVWTEQMPIVLNACGSWVLTKVESIQLLRKDTEEKKNNLIWLILQGCCYV